MPTVIARCVHGLEWLCADEITVRLPSAGGLRLGRREVVFDVATVEDGLSGLRTVDDVFVVVGQLDGVGTAKAVLPGLARGVADLPFPEAVPGRRIDVVASIEGRRAYSRFDVENAVGPAVASRLRGSYLARDATGRAPGETDLSVRLFLRGATAIAALRLGTRPLHRRTYKQDTGPGTLHPPVAAALVRLADPPDGGVVIDPFCGDGTIAIEAALAGHRVVASDLDASRLRHTVGNAARAGAALTVVRADAAALPLRPEAVSAVVTNPPWSLAVDASGRLDASLETFWVRLPELLRSDGRVGVVADESLDAPAALARLGLPLRLAARIRLAGRVSHLVLAGAGRLDDGLARWRSRAVADGVVTEDGF